MTNTQKAKFDQLIKSMENGPAHKEILRNIENPIKAADAFHNLVLDIAQKCDDGATRIKLNGAIGGFQ